MKDLKHPNQLLTLHFKLCDLEFRQINLIVAINIMTEFISKKWLGPGSNRRPNDFQSFARTN
jgi:hypothetical protein